MKLSSTDTYGCLCVNDISFQGSYHSTHLYQFPNRAGVCLFQFMTRKASVVLASVSIHKMDPIHGDFDAQ